MIYLIYYINRFRSKLIFELTSAAPFLYLFGTVDIFIISNSLGRPRMGIDSQVPEIQNRGSEKDPEKSKTYSGDKKSLQIIESKLLGLEKT